MAHPYTPTILQVGLITWTANTCTSEAMVTTVNSCFRVSSATLPFGKAPCQLLTLRSFITAATGAQHWQTPRPLEALRAPTYHAQVAYPFPYKRTCLAHIAKLKPYQCVEALENAFLMEDLLYLMASRTLMCQSFNKHKALLCHFGHWCPTLGPQQKRTTGLRMQTYKMGSLHSI